ncbi:ABC transporter permease [Phragmitibacter flavus]|uniref:Transport permease protein n=1 Tax=Phragmitibacter flavus TaxID=2576071 RepID=A0A5R8K7W4_9BACT|nr:ABC transporter permease [Phragmitibacter flavus]TLD68437.1 ABC transporter permease [Phragmitibacter flavus]
MSEPSNVTIDFDLDIQAGKVERHYWGDLWRFRELFYFLAWRDILVRYKQTVVGIAWALIQPLLTMIIFSVVFGKLGNMPSHGVPYPLFVFAALLPWQFFSRAMSEASGSLVGNANLVSKIYFPRLIIPAASVITALVDFLIAAMFLVLLMVWFQWMPSWRVVFIPGFLLMALGLAIGVGLWLAALNVTYRDFRYIVPFIVQFGLYVSPVGMSSSVVPDEWRLVYSINPMVGVIDGFRWAILGGGNHLHLPGLLLSGGLVVVILITGLRYFRATERRFADVI